MHYWQIILVGSFVVIFVIIYAVTIFFWSKDTCPIGTFPCYNSTTCVPQRNVCNFHKDCTEGDDEDPALCANLSGSLNMISRTLSKSSAKKFDYHNLYPLCSLTGFPKGCLCILQFRIVCKNRNLTEIPIGISDNVSHLILSNNSIGVINPASIANYNLKVLHLEGNTLQTIAPQVFAQQTNMERLFLMKNNLQEIKRGSFDGLINLLWIFLNHNHLTYLEMDAFNDLRSLEWMDLSNNHLSLENETFPPLPQLLELFLSNNNVSRVQGRTFSQLTNLELLCLKNNVIRFVSVNSFMKLKNLRELNLYGNYLTQLPNKLFDSLSSLGSLYLGQNPLYYLPRHLFYKMENLQSLNLDGIEIENIDLSIFSTTPNLKSVYFKKYFYCTFAPRVRRCRPLSDGISSVDQLLAKPILRYAIWITCFVTCIGNAMVIYERMTSRDENKVLSLVIKNLAASDFIMGIYMVIIAGYDLKFRNIYNKVAHEWISSWPCTFAGVLAMVSSEVSVLLLVFMSVERFLIIAVPFGRFSSIDVKKCALILGCIWILGVGLAIIPVLQFYSSTKFYGLNALCLPLHTTQAYHVGWEYSAFIVLGINFVSLITITLVYCIMFISILRTRSATTLPRKDYEFAIRFFFIVFTNGCCWFPSVLVNVLLLLGKEISGDLHAWLVVFILPINSAINPILYTFTTPKYRFNSKKVLVFFNMISQSQRSSLEKTTQGQTVPSSGGAFLTSSSI
ncbi:hypothetical protein PPYR_05873 [Photinus pyralis]|uniref:G-protein coupled receptors family 1 profile domain-containing protein n=1 Tax=Photinus pyralis TaxID=7054 RepID=A0A5N4AW07_PHOPY|nr:relaxin receptor 2 [Photinus pyralis]KAB0801519.1 hypothetical protein PPYR_05873 [Photinus pyralis]